MNDEKKYEFWIETEDKQEVRWSNLTKVKAGNMYRWTEQNLPLNVVSYGWKEQT